MSEDMWYRAEENSRMRGEEDLWIRCEFCKDPDLPAESNTESDEALIGCPKEACRHIVAWNIPDVDTAWCDPLLEEINELSNERQEWGFYDGVETLQDMPVWQDFETSGKDCLMQFLGDHHKGFKYVSQTWSNSPGSSSFGEYLFAIPGQFTTELEDVKRLLEMEVGKLRNAKE